MIIRTTVELTDAKETLGHTPEEAATLVLEALGGDPAKDTAYCTVTQAVAGMAGIDPNPPAQTT